MMQKKQPFEQRVNMQTHRMSKNNIKVIYLKRDHEISPFRYIAKKHSIYVRKDMQTYKHFRRSSRVGILSSQLTISICLTGSGDKMISVQLN